jgi:hypothetical protein
MGQSMGLDCSNYGADTSVSSQTNTDKPPLQVNENSTLGVFFVSTSRFSSADQILFFCLDEKLIFHLEEICKAKTGKCVCFNQKKKKTR